MISDRTAANYAHIVSLRRYAVTPIRRYAVTPLRRYAVTPLRRYAHIVSLNL